MRFIADRTLGKLAKALRMLGFDVIARRGENAAEAASAAAGEGRLFLTRSRRGFDKVAGLQSFIVEANDPREQMKEVLTKLGLKPDPDRFFSRCLLCNEALQPVSKEEVEGRVPDFIFASYADFHLCPGCRRIYWPGTHFQRMKEEWTGLAG